MVGAGFFLGEATAIERMARDRLTFQAWGAKLTPGQYLDRERLLRQTSHGQQNMHSWVLRLPNAVVVASCETFRLPLMPHGVIEVIASVYVDRPLRGVKMASRLMEALVNARQEAGIDGLILFSEVGTDLYARAGFKPLPAPMRSWRGPLPMPEKVEWLTRESLLAALETRARWREGRIELRMSDLVVDWHLERARFYAETLNRRMAPHIGARVNDVQALWTPDFKNNLLRILDVSGPAGTSLEPVMAAAVAEATELGLSTVELWDDAFSLQLPGGEQRERDDDVPMGQSFTPVGELFMGPLSRACWA